MFALAFSLLLAAAAAPVLATSNGQGQSQCQDLSTVIGVGTVFTPADESYYQARSQFASQLGSYELSDTMLSPDAIVIAQSEQDIWNALAFANDCQYSVSVRSGGHQYAGHSSCKAGAENRCIQIDMSAFTGVEFVDGTNLVTVGVGNTLESLNGQLMARQLTIPHGVCKSVGVGGHFQTSSVGLLTRSFGLGMDLVKSFRIMTADGTIHTVSEESDWELYAGVLGGAPGSFGVVLDYTFEALQNSDAPNARSFIFGWPYQNELFQNIGVLFTETMSKPELERDLNLYLVVANPGSLRAQGDIDTHLIFIYGVWTGVDSGLPLEGEMYDKYIKPFDEIAGVPPNKFFDSPVPLHFAQFPFLVDFNVEKYRYFEHSITSTVLPGRDFYKVAADQIDYLINIDTVYVVVDFQPWGAPSGGTQMQRNLGKNGYPTRDLVLINDWWIFFADESLSGDIEASIRDLLQMAEGTFFYQSKRVWQSTETITAAEADLEKDGADMYYPVAGQFENLLLLKARVDPNDIFSSSMTIPLHENLVDRGNGNDPFQRKVRRG